MVDVRGVISPDFRGQLSLDGKVLFSPMWLAVHRRKENLMLKREFDEILDAPKFSWRIMAEMLLELEEDGVPDWARYEWVVFDLKTHQVMRVDEPVGGMRLSFEVGGNVIDPGKFWYGWSVQGKPGVYDGLVATSEHQFNQSMMKLFGKKFPIRLKSMSPFAGKVTVSVPVDKPDPSKSMPNWDKMKRAMR